MGRSSEILNLCTVLKNLEPVHVKHGKCIFVPKCDFSRMRIKNLNLMMQKCSRVVQMIIAHKSFHIIMPPTLKKLMGHIAFGGCVGGSHFLYLL